MLSHAEQPEVSVPVVARPAGSERVLELVERLAGPVVDDPDLGLGRVTGPTGQRDGDARTLTFDEIPEELVEAGEGRSGGAGRGLPRCSVCCHVAAIRRGGPFLVILGKGL